MIAILSPARNTQVVPATGVEITAPLFMQQTMQLVNYLREYSPWQLESLLDVPPERAFRLYDAYQSFNPKEEGSPALLAYYGAAYRNMQPQTFTKQELCFAQNHLRILSALYGMLRPLDGVQVHRLGLKKDFSPNGKTLYEFWGERLYKELFAKNDTVINLASLEYTKLVAPFLQPHNKIVTCRFLIDKPGGAKGTVSTVRAARGLMARYIVKNQVNTPEELKGFKADGYRFITGRSSSNEYVFIKKRS